MKPRLLDLFCGAGGAAMGYARAGFEVVGVDLNKQPHYPFEFIQADALTFPTDGFNAIHASPPCQAYSSATADRSKHPDLYAITIELLTATGLPYVVENVIGAPYGSGVILCGSMFGLVAEGEWLQRHRNFETPFLIMQPPHLHPATPRPVSITGKSYVSVTREFPSGHSRQGTFVLAQKLMGIDWMTRDELAQAIPPAYTEFIGQQLLYFVREGEVTLRNDLHPPAGPSPAGCATGCATARCWSPPPTSTAIPASEVGTANRASTVDASCYPGGPGEVHVTN